MGTELTWETIQERVWTCESCRDHGRVEINARQQTPAPTMPVSLLFVSVAPPHHGSPAVRTSAKSATNDPDDNLRKFIETAAAVPWRDLIAKGGFLVHAVKCAIISDGEGFQNPPNDVVDRCRPIGFDAELQRLRPARVVAFGGAARRALLKHPSITAPR